MNGGGCRRLSCAIGRAHRHAFDLSNQSVVLYRGERVPDRHSRDRRLLARLQRRVVLAARASRAQHLEGDGDAKAAGDEKAYLAGLVALVDGRLSEAPLPQRGRVGQLVAFGQRRPVRPSPSSDAIPLCCRFARWRACPAGRPVARRAPAHNAHRTGTRGARSRRAQRRCSIGGKPRARKPLRKLGAAVVAPREQAHCCCARGSGCAYREPRAFPFMLTQRRRCRRP